MPSPTNLLLLAPLRNSIARRSPRAFSTLITSNSSVTSALRQTSFAAPIIMAVATGDHPAMRAGGLANKSNYPSVTTPGLAHGSLRFSSTLSGSDSGPGANIKNITVFGAGLMGAGIAQVAAQAGYQVVLSDVTDQALQNGLNIISKSLARVAKKLAQSESVNVGEQGEAENFDETKWKRECLERIRTTTDAADAVQDADLVVEAIIESMKIKNELFKFIDSKAKPDCIFASNTSSLSIAEIGSPVSEARKQKFAGLHYFNPVPAMKLVEIIRTDKTDDATINALVEVTKRQKKVPVNCKDTPGFIVNRLLMPYLLESIRMVERGEATIEDIDIAMELGAGYPMGPFKLLDFIGLDTTAHISGGWREKANEGKISKEIVEPIPMLEKLLKEGRYGKKSGKGFYDYSSKL